MPETTIDTLVRILRRQAAAGRRAAPLSAAVREALFSTPRQADPGGTPASIRPAPVRPAPPAPSPRAAPPAVALNSSRPTPASAPATSSSSAPAATPDVSALGWDELQGLVSGCTRCALAAGRTQTVFGAGNRRAEVMFIGEAPGRDEDAQGLPFVGAAGQLLTKMIAAMQFERDTVYIANIVKCRPPRNRPPEDAEALACLPYLRRQIELVKPRVIVTLGATPLQALLGRAGIAREHGVWGEFAGIPVLPTFHPAYLLRAPERKRDAWEDLKSVMARLGRPPAPSSRGTAPDVAGG